MASLKDRVEANKDGFEREKRAVRGEARPTVEWYSQGCAEKICCRLSDADDRNLIIDFLFPAATKNWESIRCF